MNRRLDKAEILVAAWKNRFNNIPNKNAVVMVCSVAEHETLCGDAWSFSGNWGAIQRRMMSADEKRIALTGADPPPTDPFEELHGDSSPIHGKYRTWFWRFPENTAYAPYGLSGQEAGAAMLLHVLLQHRTAISNRILVMGPTELATLMYDSHYYEGVHDPRKTGGREDNIADYAKALNWASGAFYTALEGWQPNGMVHPVDHDLGSVLGVQQVLNDLGYLYLLKEDGVMGPKTRGNVMLFQSDHGLKVDGIVGPLTREALRKAFYELPSKTDGTS